MHLKFLGKRIRTLSLKKDSSQTKKAQQGNESFSSTQKSPQDNKVTQGNFSAYFITSDGPRRSVSFELLGKRNRFQKVVDGLFLVKSK